MRGSCWALAALAGCTTAAECCRDAEDSPGKGPRAHDHDARGIERERARRCRWLTWRPCTPWTSVAADKVVFAYRIAAPNDPKAAAMLRKSPRFTRVVRTEDLRTATRLNALFSSADPELFAGQTFLQTSTAVLTALKSVGRDAFGLRHQRERRARSAAWPRCSALPPGPPQAAPTRGSRSMSPACSLARHGASLLPRHAQARRAGRREVFSAAEWRAYRGAGGPRQGPAEVLRPAARSGLLVARRCRQPAYLRWSADTTTYAVLTRIDTARARGDDGGGGAAARWPRGWPTGVAARSCMASISRPAARSCSRNPSPRSSRWLPP